MSRTIKEIVRELRPHRTAVIVTVLAAIYFAVGGYIIDQQRTQTNELIEDVAAQTARIDRQNDTINAGRKVSSAAVCAFGSALAEAGRAILDAAAAPPQGARAKRFERNLERLGYPPLKERRRQAAGQAYVDSIAERVERETGIAGLVVKRGPKAGTLSCERLQRAAKIP